MPTAILACLIGHHQKFKHHLDISRLRLERLRLKSGGDRTPIGSDEHDQALWLREEVPLNALGVQRRTTLWNTSGCLAYFRRHHVRGEKTEGNCSSLRFLCSHRRARMESYFSNLTDIHIETRRSLLPIVNSRSITKCTMYNHFMSRKVSTGLRVGLVLVLGLLSTLFTRLANGDGPKSQISVFTFSLFSGLARRKNAGCGIISAPAPLIGVASERIPSSKKIWVCG